MKKLLASVFGLSLLATPALAQPVDELLDEIDSNQCAQALKSCKDSGVGQAWGGARRACAALRSCKQDCRKGKRGAKRDERAEKRECKQACKGKKGKARRQCKKECRKEFREGKREIRGEKRDCTRECRAEFKTPACKKARKGVVKALADCAKKAGGPCFKELQKLGK